MGPDSFMTKRKSPSKYKLICPIPWTSITVLPNQRTVVCCATRSDMKNKPGESALDTFKGKKMTEIRKTFLKGEWPKECWECERAENTGQFSKRQDTLRIKRFQDFLEKTNLTE